MKSCRKENIRHLKWADKNLWWEHTDSVAEETHIDSFWTRH